MISEWNLYFIFVGIIWVWAISMILLQKWINLKYFSARLVKAGCPHWQPEKNYCMLDGEACIGYEDCITLRIWKKNLPR
jgi:hypothetical protein